MKTKKLIAILTIVALMMGLVPMAAFAAEEFSASNSFMEVDKETAAAGTEFKFTIGVKDSDGAFLTGYTIVAGDMTFHLNTDAFGSESTIGGIEVDSSIATAAGWSKEVATDENGAIVAAIKFTAPGTYTLKAYKGSISDGLLIGEKTVTVTATGATVGKVVVTSDGGTVGLPFDVVATVTDDNGIALAGQTVTFENRNAGVGGYTRLGTAVTDNWGKATYRVTKNVAGKYDFRAKVGGKTSEDVDSALNVNVGTGFPYTVAANAEAVPGKQGVANNVFFTVKDILGNKVTSTEGLIVTVLDPDKKIYAHDSIDIGDDVINSTDVRVVFTPTTTGAYVVTVRFDKTAISASTTVNVGNFGTAKDMTVTPSKTSLKAGQTSPDELTLTAFLVDENGITKSVDDVTNDLVISSNNTALASVNGDKIVAQPMLATTRGVVTITAVHKEYGFVKTLEIPIVGAPAGIVATPTVTDKVVTVDLQLVDNEGRVTNYGVDSALKVIEPAGVAVTNIVNFDDTTGKASFTATTTDYGDKSFTVVSDQGLAATFTVSFGVPKVVDGAKNVVMFIGAKAYTQDGVAKITDVAPFIRDSRTFVAVRPVAEAFNAEIDWDEATRTVTLTRADITVVIVIGSNTITVVRDGVTEIVTADVAADIVDGRTVLPFRAVGEAFGATVNYDATTQSVSFVQE